MKDSNGVREYDLHDGCPKNKKNQTNQVPLPSLGKQVLGWPSLTNMCFIVYGMAAVSYPQALCEAAIDEDHRAQMETRKGLQEGLRTKWHGPGRRTSVGQTTGGGRRRWG